MFTRIPDTMVVAMIIRDTIYVTKRGKQYLDTKRFYSAVKQYREFGHNQFCKHNGITRDTILKWLNRGNEFIKPITDFEIYKADEVRFLEDA